MYNILIILSTSVMILCYSDPVVMNESLRFNFDKKPSLNRKSNWW